MSSDAATGGGETDTGTTRGVDPAQGSRRILEECFNGANFAAADELIAPEAFNHDPAQPAHMRGLRGPEALKRSVRMYRAAFPDLHLTIDDVIAAGDKVAIRWHTEGTHRGELEGLAPTGAHGSVTGISIDHWQGGKIVESWTEWDNLGLARQLGAAPPEGSPGEKIGMAMQRMMARRMRKKNLA
jgi:predicted ester cyclase